MKRNGTGVVRFIALCSLTMIVISGVVFAQHPRLTATPTPAADARDNVSSVTSERPASSGMNERERVLLERLERLERMLIELKSCLCSTTMTSGSGPATAAPPAEPTNAAPPNAVALQQSATPPKAAASPQQQPTQTTKPLAPPPSAAWDKDGVKIIPYGILIANINYNSSALDTGSIVGFALPGIPANPAQFNISPGNTYLGADIKWPKIGKWEINGKVDFDLRGPTPIRGTNNIFAPLFINLYGEAKTERYRIMAGQAPDIVSPLHSNSLNLYPVGYLPGKLGFFRPQARFETYQPISDNFTFIFQGAIAQAIQTFQVSDEVIGDQTGRPDGQIRLALGYGKPDLNDPYQRRPFELGVFGHIGKRRGTQLGRLITQREFTSWSGDIDLSFKIGSKLRFNGEFFTGAILGDYAGGIFQTFNPERLVAIRAAGAWAQLTYDISDKWQVNGGYGHDDPFNRDLAFGQRSLNAMGFGNFYYRITPRLWVAVEFSRWRTDWVDLPAGRAFRVEPAVLFFF
ncbi:MAG: hypothetical protein AB7U82_00790 [Blastocatellales bacterium]